MKIFLIIILLILLLPIPIKLSICYSKENYYIKLYKFTILKKGTKNGVENNKKKINEKKINEIKKKKTSNFFFTRSFDPKKIVKALDRNKFKPTLRLEGSLSYSLNDAAKTAISYGAISATMPLILRIINVFFKSKKFKFPITPQFKDDFIVNFDIKSIIFLSLAQIIYMLFLIARGSVPKKEVKDNE